MKVSDLAFGDVIGSHWKHLKCYDIPGHQIQRHQRVKYGRDSYWYDTHSVTALGGTRYFEVTSPRARYGDVLDDWEEGRIYSVSRFRYPILQGERSAILEVCDGLDGTKYDYFQLLDIGIKQILHWPTTRPLSIFDMSRQRKVCSVAVILGFLNWWEKYGKEHGEPRPLGEQDAEVCCPADFANYPADFAWLGYLER